MANEKYIDSLLRGVIDAIEEIADEKIRLEEYLTAIEILTVQTKKTMGAV